MKILLIDDHTLFRAGLALLLPQLGEGLELLETDNGAQAIQLARQHSDLDLALLDLALPDLPGLDVLKALRQSAPTVPVVILSASQQQDDVINTMSLGAQGYISKASSSEVMLGALRLVLSGGVYLPPEVLPPKAQWPINDHGSKHDPKHGLTERQIEVLHWLAQGKSNKQISRQLDISVSTVQVHVAAILKTLGASNRAEAVYTARQLGLIC